MGTLIYADNAATTKLDLEAFEAMKPYLLDYYGNSSQPYSFARRGKRALKEARKAIASCINAEPEEIYFTSGGTESDNWVIKNFGLPGDIKRAIVSEIEHHAILNACKHIENYGTAVSYIPVDKRGLVSLEALERLLHRGNEVVASCETSLVSVMLANNEIGTIEPIKEIASVAHKHGALFHTDAVQAVGHVAIDVKELGVDYLSASAHKFNGPKGVGFLYVRKGVILQPLIDGGSQENGIRAGTENLAGIIGMAKALENNIVNMVENESKILGLERKIVEILKDNNVEFVRNGYSNHIPGNMSLSFKGYEGEAILHRLDLMGICVSTGSACDSKRTQISHVLKSIGLDEEFAKGTIRISLGKSNTDTDAEAIGNALVKVLKK